MSADQIVAAAQSYIDQQTVFAGGCSDMVRNAYAAGGIAIPQNYQANDILQNYPCPVDVQPGDIAGWIKNPNGHVVIYLGPNKFANCPDLGQATKLNTNMGNPLTYVRPA